jgi:hypothetical protein
MQISYTMKVRDVGNCLKSLNCLLDLIPHDHEVDTIFSKLNLKELLLKSTQISWQNANTEEYLC